MVNVQEAKAGELINKTAEKLSQEEDMKMPEWAKHVKTGADKEKRPQQKNWWHLRQASLLRRLYLEGPVGTERLRTWYGTRKNRGSKPEKKVKSGGKVIRTCLQQLEEAGYAEKTKQGRKITSKGRSLLDKTTLETKSQ